MFGLIAGAIAKFIMPGKDPGGLIITSLIGIAGGVLGGGISTWLGYGDVEGFDLGSLATAVGGALLLLFGYRKIRGA